MNEAVIAMPSAPSIPWASAETDAELGVARAAQRVSAIDAIRGLALVLMALDHAAFLSGLSVRAEHYAQSVTTLPSWPYIVSGLLTNMATPTFWLVGGTSVGLYCRAQRRRRASEWSITRFLLIRAVCLLLLDLMVVGLIRGSGALSVSDMLQGRGGLFDYEYQFDILSSLGLGIAVLSVLRFLPIRAIVGLSIGLLIGYEWLLIVMQPIIDREQSFLLHVLFSYNEDIAPPVKFPILGWFGLMGLGYSLNHLLASPGFREPKVWFGGAIGVLAIWLLVRIAGGYGNIVPYSTSDPWYYFLIMAKGPPSLCYLLFNLGLALIALAAFLHLKMWSARRPISWLRAFGQASLFFYVAHLAVYLVLGRAGIVLAPAGFPDLARYCLTWLAGLALLLPLARAYRDVRKRHPRSVLQYL